MKTPKMLIKAGTSPRDGIVDDVLKKYGLEHLLKKFKDNPAGDDDDDDDDGEDPFSFFNPFGDNEQNLNNRGIIFISGPITKDLINRASKRLLTLHFDREFQDDIQLILNSPGGYCDAGWAFIDLMSFCANRIRTIVMGEVASMALNIFIAGDYRMMAPNAQAMVHHFSWGSQGNYADLVAQRKAEDMEYQRELQHLIRCSKYDTEADIREYILHDQDHWLTPAEMKQHGLCEAIYAPKEVSKKGVEKRLGKPKKRPSATPNRTVPKKVQKPQI